ncbi:MAG TPA: BlaI/MecI/CopY family transcriptional regulator [Marmoricola sp.]|nr:BlaI/MecI/CopY family transcriptional regulator [Marmoricola sp.]
MPVQGTRGRGELEREVLACVAAAHHPVTASDVLADLGPGLAYTTVMTTLSRLAAKGVLHRELDGRAYRYAVAGQPDQVPAAMTAHRMRKLLEGRADRAGILTRFVEDLNAEDAEVLRGLLSDGPESGGQ